jgi:hypothetical protein
MRMELVLSMGCIKMVYGDVVRCEVLSEAVSQAVRPNLVRLAMDVCRQPAELVAVSSSYILGVSGRL